MCIAYKVRLFLIFTDSQLTFEVINKISNENICDFHREQVVIWVNTKENAWKY